MRFGLFFFFVWFFFQPFLFSSFQQLNQKFLQHQVWMFFFISVSQWESGPKYSTNNHRGWHKSEKRKRLVQLMKQRRESQACIYTHTRGKDTGGAHQVITGEGTTGDQVKTIRQEGRTEETGLVLLLQIWVVFSSKFPGSCHYFMTVRSRPC